MSVLGRALLSEMCRLEHTEEPVRPTVPLIIVSSEFCYEESSELTSAPPQQRRDLLCPPETSKEENPWQTTMGKPSKRNYNFFLKEYSKRI